MRGIIVRGIIVRGIIVRGIIVRGIIVRAGRNRVVLMRCARTAYHKICNALHTY